mmetsp:Transcript_22219/g.47099  ORF Transcript_22219/g.47099 Transcript_22219/m.47099 type:complete len:569 (+) Transcript_22219:252-1958(+)
MKAVFSFTLRRFYATILSLFTLLIYAELEDVHGFESNGGFQQQRLVGRRSMRGSSVHGPVVSFAPTNKDDPRYSCSYQTYTSRSTNNSNNNRLQQGTILSMALGVVPTLDKWKVIPGGSVIGTVRNPPAIADGDVITTSPIQDPELAGRQVTVTTASGSKYKLMEPRGEISAAAREREALALEAALALADEMRENNSINAMAGTNTNNQKSSSPQKSNFFGGWAGPFNSSNNNKAATEDPSVSGSNDISEARQKEILRSSPEWQEATRIYSLTGDIIGLEDEYLLASKPERSTSGKSNIWEAYKTDESTGLPVDNAVPVCMKISSNLEAISREYENYRKLSFLGIWETGRFVRCYEFFPVAGYDKKFRDQCALAIERGARDLKSFLNSRGKLEKKELKDACVSATQCVQALHRAGLVWTDMKTENFVVMPNGEVKGIDLESAMPIGDYPVDYSPEACPPEFATAFLAGEGPYFELGTSYDVWSLGMLMLELSTGRGYFDGKTPAQITKQLRDMDEYSMTDYLDDVECEERLKDLIRRCLQKDSQKRPNTAQILMHPYFLAGNPFSFFS